MDGFMIFPPPIITSLPPPPPPPRPFLQYRPPPPPPSYSVPFSGKTLHVTVAKKAVHVHQWISTIRRLHRHSPHKLIVGLDTEWLPNTAPGDDHPIAILQLSVGLNCLIFQLLHADFIPQSLHAFLADPRHIFCGVGVQDDVKKLYAHHGLCVGSVSDLNELVRLGSGEDVSRYRYIGLKKMAMNVLGKEMKKPFHVTMSKWDNVDLDLDQVEYAAIDAFVSFEVAYLMYAYIFS